MNGLQKVLVVDNGERTLDCALSAELAEMGYASVTAPLEATEDVLALMRSPAAVVLHIPRHAAGSERRQFLELAERLRKNLQDRNTPVIVMTGIGGSGAQASLLQSELGTRILSRASDPKVDPTFGSDALFLKQRIV
jgi:CheY-like chemotaxis protein